MNQKNQEYYEFILRIIIKISKKYNINIKPQFIISDFELSEINAIKNSFPNSRIIGCWFHYSQAIQKWFATNKPKIINENNLSANLVKSKIICLPWIPIKLIRYYWNNNLIKKYLIISYLLIK